MPASMFPRSPHGSAGAVYGRVAPTPVLLQGVAHEGDREYYASDVFLERFWLLPNRPTNSIASGWCNFSCHSSIDLVYSRYTFIETPP